ncbi:MAG: DNA polymerase III subunit [Chitinophagales bacterium]|nr:DNA polymerase III subunit [Chitinophagales bacterium]
MQFSDIPEHNKLKRQLISGVETGKVAQAVLFHGNEGNASLPIAIALSQYLNCQNKSEFDSCGECVSCVKAKKFIHPDIHFTYPVIPKSPSKPSLSTDFIKEWRAALKEMPYMNIYEWMNFIKAENKQGNIAVDECRSIIRTLSLKSFEGDYKIYIIWGAENLAAAGNVLLKILEEPPPNTVFLLITYNKAAILNTIISRVQQIKVNKFSDKAVEEFLVNHESLDAEAAKSISRLADGNMLSAMRMIDKKDALNNYMFIDWLRYLLAISRKNDQMAYVHLNTWVDDIAKLGREQQKAFLKFAQFFLSETVSLFADRDSRLDDNEKELALYLKENYNAATLLEMQRIFNDMHYFIERNAHAKAMFFSNSLRIKNLLIQVDEPVKI